MPIPGYRGCIRTQYNAILVVCSYTVNYGKRKLSLGEVFRESFIIRVLNSESNAENEVE